MIKRVIYCFFSILINLNCVIHRSQGIFEAILIRVYTKLAKDLNVIPGAELRAAYKKALNIKIYKTFLYSILIIKTGL